MVPDKSARISIRFKAALALVVLIWAFDLIFDVVSSKMARTDCLPRTVETVDTSGFWTVTVICGKIVKAPEIDDDALLDPVQS